MMKKKYGIFIIILIFLLAGAAFSVINHFYSFNYIYNLLFERDFAINPKVKVNPKREYRVNIWYYPFYRTLEEDEKEEEYFQQVEAEVQKKYPNIKFNLEQLTFLEGRDKLQNALAKGNPPDIYFNFFSDILIDDKYQIPVEPYINGEERQGFYTVGWEEINVQNHLWAWPFLVHRQYWVANTKINALENENNKILQSIYDIDNEVLGVNFADQTLLRQFLSLYEVENIQEDQEKVLEMFRQLHLLRHQQVFIEPTNRMENLFLREFFKDEPVLIGPVNPWLHTFLQKKHQEKLYYYNLDHLIKLYTLAVFRQKDYQGDDHTRAVMEVAKTIIMKAYNPLTEKLRLETAYLTDISSERDKGVHPQLLYQVKMEDRKYWREKLIPAWLKFWREGLTPEEVQELLVQGD